MNDLDVAILEDLYPLRGGLSGPRVVFSPIGVPSWDEAEDGMRIDIVGVWESILKDNGLKSQDKSPSGFFFSQSRIKDQGAIIIQRGNEIPFLLGGGGPEVK